MFFVNKNEQGHYETFTNDAMTMHIPSSQRPKRWMKLTKDVEIKCKHRTASYCDAIAMYWNKQEK